MGDINVDGKIIVKWIFKKEEPVFKTSFSQMSTKRGKFQNA
jgi:hypothetical protein